MKFDLNLECCLFSTSFVSSQEIDEATQETRNVEEEDSSSSSSSSDSLSVSSMFVCVDHKEGEEDSPGSNIGLQVSACENILSRVYCRDRVFFAQGPFPGRGRPLRGPGRGRRLQHLLLPSLRQEVPHRQRLQGAPILQALQGADCPAICQEVREGLNSLSLTSDIMLCQEFLRGPVLLRLWVHRQLPLQARRDRPQEGGPLPRE